jgi:hypothetical protein
MLILTSTNTIHWVVLVMTRLLLVCVWQLGLGRYWRATSEWHSGIIKWRISFSVVLSTVCFIYLLTVTGLKSFVIYYWIGFYFLLTFILSNAAVTFFLAFSLFFFYNKKHHFVSHNQKQLNQIIFSLLQVYCQLKLQVVLISLYHSPTKTNKKMLRH